MPVCTTVNTTNVFSPTVTTISTLGYFCLPVEFANTGVVAAFNSTANISFTTNSTTKGNPACSGIGDTSCASDLCCAPRGLSISG